MPPTSDALSRTFIFKNVSLTISGSPVPVASIQLMLAEQAIPALRVIIDPAHGVDDPHDPASVATLDVLAAANDSYQKDADTRKTLCNLKVEVHNKDGVQQRLTLSDWVLTGAGIVGASASGSFALELTIQHPIVNLDLSSMYMGSLRSQFYPFTGDGSYANIVEAFTDIFKQYAEAKRELTTLAQCIVSAVASLEPSVEQIKSSLERELRRVAAEIPERLKWDNFDGVYSDWPLQDECLNEFLPEIQAAVDGYVLGLGQMTVWETLVGSLCPEWQLSVIPTFWEPYLKLRPFSPWMEPSIQVYDDEISDLTFPGVDPAPYAIVSIPTYDASSDGGYSSYSTGSNGEKLENSPDVYYAPPKVVKGEMIGRSMIGRSPSWVSGIGVKDVGHGGKVTALNPKETKDKLKLPNNIPPGTAPTVEGDDMLYRRARVRAANYPVAHALFLSQFRRAVEASFRSPLMFQSQDSRIEPHDTFGGYITAGHVVQVLSRQSERVIFDFYVTNVVHLVDFQAGIARTEYTGRFARPTGEAMADLTYIGEQGTPNPIWAKGSQ